MRRAPRRALRVRDRFETGRRESRRRRSGPGPRSASISTGALSGDAFAGKTPLSDALSGLGGRGASPFSMRPRRSRKASVLRMFGKDSGENNLSRVK